MTTTVNGAKTVDNPNPIIANATQAVATLYTYRCVPALGVTTAIHAAIVQSTTSGTTVTTSITNPDFPRVLTITGSTAGLLGNVVIAGTDQQGGAVSDTIAITGTSTVVGAKVFTTVTTITAPQSTISGGTTVAIGTANVIGFPAIVKDVNFVLRQTFAGSTDAGTFTASATLALNKYSPAGTLNASSTLAFLVGLY
jgi:hypothetical protein